MISLVLEVRLARLSQARTAEICEGRLERLGPREEITMVE